MKWSLVVVFLALAGHLRWLGDDSYIIFRCVENWLGGHGLSYNAAERVQAFTCPLWTFAIAGARLVTGEVFYASLGLSLALSVVAFFRLASHSLLAGALLLFSVSFMDYTTSGLETPLSYFLYAGFLLALLRNEKLVWLALWAGLLVLNRMDAALLVAPALIWRSNHDGHRRPLLVAAAPIVLWCLFAAFYYGFPLPNTAYAKLSTGLPVEWRIEQGGWYFLNFLRRDLVGAACCIAAIFWGRKHISSGVVLYLAYILYIGGDFMSGRFFALPIMAGAITIGQVCPWPRRAAAVAALCGLLALADPQGIGPLEKNHGIADEARVYRPFTDPVPDHDWVRHGMRFRENPGTYVVDAAGWIGYFAGPECHIIDRYGLCDPVLARMPITPGTRVRVGHYIRIPPKGYPHNYDGPLLPITRGPLWSWARLDAIIKANLGGAV